VEAVPVTFDNHWKST